MWSVSDPRFVPNLPGLPVAGWLRVAAERRRLASLDAERLADLGITPAEARREASRPFWDLPAGR